MPGLFPSSSPLENVVFKPKVLFVDDSEFLIKFNVALLEKIKQNSLLNFECLVAYDGAEAV